MNTLLRKVNQFFESVKLRRCNTLSRTDSTKEPLDDESPEDSDVDVPHGHVPVYVGEEMVRFVVKAKVLNHPVLVNLLSISAQVYGYDQGVLRIPCRVVVFEQILEAIRLGRNSGAIHELLSHE